MHVKKRLFDNIFYTVADYLDQLRILNWGESWKEKLNSHKEPEQKTKIKRIRIKFEKKNQIIIMDSMIKLKIN
jgi:hypothetical protein